MIKQGCRTRQVVRVVILAGWDGLAWVFAVIAGTWLRFDGDLSNVQLLPTVQLIAGAVVLQAGFGYLAYRYHGRQLIGAMDDAIHVAGVTTAVGTALFMIGLSGAVAAPRSVPVIATLIALCLVLGPRVALRLAREHRARPDAASAKRVIVFGAGVGGQQLVRSMLSGAESGYFPVALIDDDPATRARRICGVAVRGTRADIADVARATRAEILAVAVRNLDIDVMREVSRNATQAGLRVQVVPALIDLFRPWIGFSDLRDIDIADLIGRRPVDVDVGSIAGYLAGKKVLVTGAGGSIGSELCRQVLQYGPAELLMLDRDESALHALQLSISGRALLDSPDIILADIRDATTISHIFDERRPDVALEIALRALGVGPGDEVIVPSATFIATASAVVACGARPVVVDVDRDSQAVTPDTVAPAINPRTTAVIVVHLGGYPAGTGALAKLTDAHGLSLVEDCAQAHGARRDGHHVGRRGRIAAWSFCQDKIMTTAGEGGAVTTADADLAQRCWELKDHGKSYAAVHQQEHPPGFRWLHHRFGTNARMTEMQAAVGRLQLPKLSGWVAQRRAHADILRAALEDLPSLRLPRIASGVEHAYYRFYGHVCPERLKPGWDRDRIVAAICAEGVPCAAGGCTEIYRERAFDAVGRPATPLPVADWLGRHSLVLPVHPALSAGDITDVGAAVRKVFVEVAK